MNLPSLQRLAQTVLNAYQAAGLVIITAESCTGGMVAAALTDVAGASSVFMQGFVTYSNEAKIAMLGVSEAHFLAHGAGAVSEPVARAMAQGAAARAILPAGIRGAVAVSVTGIAGPQGGSIAKPVGTVHLATASTFNAEIEHAACHFTGDRAAIRAASVQQAFEMLGRYAERF
ncbi:MAG: CinA family protein [Rickettsiales bacterium]|nr:CinA family protein [Rickettsiales bacterium]